jgi:ABC-type branched-subunit amino acid transport system ATPase component
MTGADWIRSAPESFKAARLSAPNQRRKLRDNLLPHIHRMLSLASTMKTAEGTKSLRSAKILDEFTIDRFRGLDNVSFNQLGLINLLVGANDSGKTSVLEALAIFSNPLDIATWSSIARNREARPTIGLSGAGLNAVEAVRWLFPKRVDDALSDETKTTFHLSCTGRSSIHELRAQCISIRGIPPEPPRRLGRERIAQPGLIEDQGWLISAQVVSDQLLTKEDSIEVQLWPSVGFYRGTRWSGPHTRAVMLAPYSHRNQPLQLRRLSELIESEQKLNVIELLRNLDPDVLDLQIVTDKYTGTPNIQVKHRHSGAVPVSVLGDGFRRALAIALSIPQARGGVLLIDEIETALFVSFLQKLFSWLVRACKDFDVQLFATSHSLEAITGLVNAMPDTFADEFTAYHLSSPGEPVKRYSSEMLVRLVRDRGLDIR